MSQSYRLRIVNRNEGIARLQTIFTPFGGMCNPNAVHVVAIAFISFLLIQSGRTQTKTAKYPLTQFNNEGCMEKGRVQDCSGPVIKRILADGKNAIPILISQLTETAPTKYQIDDYWADTRSGDVAYIVLTDLFTKPDSETSEMPGVPDWKIVMNGCHATAQGCWDEFLHKHGRKSVQQAWLRAWNLHRDKVYWDAKVQCFRVPAN